MSKSIYRNNWIHIYSGFVKTTFRIGPASYFNDRAHAHFTPSLIIPLIGIFFTGLSLWSLIWIPFLCIGYGKIFLDLPIHSGIDESDPPEYGFYFYGESRSLVFTSFWWCWGMDKKCFHMPWEWDWVRTSKLKKDGTWEHETRKNRKDFYNDKWKNILWKESYPYTYVLSKGKIQNRIATVMVDEREWRCKSLKWFPLIRMKSKSISVEFSYAGPFERFVLIEKKGYPTHKAEDETGEVGERTGTYKGGTIGCSYSMLKKETPLETLRRMEKERKF